MLVFAYKIETDTFTLSLIDMYRPEIFWNSGKSNNLKEY